MDKESIFELQKIDANCNDCIFMERDFDTFKKWENWHRELQLVDFEAKQEHALKVANECLDVAGKKSLLFLANKMKFVFNRSNLITYGKCKKFNKDISFMPATCQSNTQECFKHRKEI